MAYWKLVRLGDAAVVTPEGAREVQITLASEDHRVQGFAGCNHVNGGYTLEGKALRFGVLATTRMACANGMDTEAAFLAALEATRGWKIEGDTLALTNAEGATLARFEAVYLR
jgi:copper homeostasis protein (lipoprotein)